MVFNHTYSSLPHPGHSNPALGYLSCYHSDAYIKIASLLTRTLLRPSAIYTYYHSAARICAKLTGIIHLILNNRENAKKCVFFSTKTLLYDEKGLFLLKIKYYISTYHTLFSMGGEKNAFFLWALGEKNVRTKAGDVRTKETPIEREMAIA